MIVTPLATIMIQTYGWRTSMMFTAIAATVLILPVALLIRPAPAALADGPPATGAAEAAAPATSPAAKSSGCRTNFEYGAWIAEGAQPFWR